jgi:RNA polymerase sigma factor (sigma-70 family)
LQDKELADRLRAGDERAFKQFYDAYADMVYRLSLRLLQNREEAEDATQDIFCKLLASLQSFRAQATLSSWIYRITLNHCLNLQRQKKRRRWLSLDWPTGATEPASGPDESPLGRIEQQEQEDLLAAAISNLPEKQRAALVLHRFEGKSYQEIAEIAGCSVAAVESRLFQAKKNLCKTLLPLIKDTSFS